MSNFKEVCAELKAIIEAAYEEGVSMQQAERLAARTLNVRLMLSDEIKTVDLDARMKKHGVKAIRAQVYLEEIAKHDKKPTETFLESAVNLNTLVEAAERQYAEADTTVDQIKSYLGVFQDAHIYFRSVMRGSFEG